VDGVKKLLKTRYIPNFPVHSIKLGTAIRTDAKKITGLGQSIKNYGLINPIVIDENNFVVMGKRRLLAVRKQRYRRVPVLRVISEDKLALQLIENLQREDLNPMDKAKAFKAFKEKTKMGAREMGLALGVSHSVIERHLNLLLIPKNIQRKIYSGDIHPFYNEEVKHLIHKETASQLTAHDFVDPILKSVKYRLKAVKRTLREKGFPLADLLIIKAEAVELLTLLDELIKKEEKVKK
jgi:ParB/RepB/Spo0J family partition protein